MRVVKFAICEKGNLLLLSTQKEEEKKKVIVICMLLSNRTEASSQWMCDMYYVIL